MFGRFSISTTVGDRHRTRRDKASCFQHTEYRRRQAFDVHTTAHLAFKNTDCPSRRQASNAHMQSSISPGFLTCLVLYVPNACIFYRHGSIQGAPMCDCIENMPVVSRADCTTFSSKGLVNCERNDLRTHYYNEMRRPGGNIRFNLVETCDNKKGR